MLYKYKNNKKKRKNYVSAREKRKTNTRHNKNEVKNEIFGDKKILSKRIFYFKDTKLRERLPNHQKKQFMVHTRA